MKQQTDMDWAKEQVDNALYLIKENIVINFFISPKQNTTLFMNMKMPDEMTNYILIRNKILEYISSDEISDKFDVFWNNKIQ